MSLQYAVIGLGEFGRSVLNTLVLEGCDVVAIDNEYDKIQEVSNIATYAVAIDATDESTLISAGIKTVDVAIVGVGRNIQTSIMVNLMLKELGVKKIIAKAVNFTHGKVLKKIGVDKIVYPEIDMGERVAKGIVSQNVFEHIELVKGYSIIEIMVPESYVGLKLKDSKIRNKFDINIVAVFNNYHEKNSNVIVCVPKADYVFQKEDVLLIFGKDPDIEKFKE